MTYGAIFYYKKHHYSHVWGQKNLVIDCGEAGLSRSGRELEILINLPIRYLSLYKNESIGQHIKSPRIQAARGKWCIKLLVLNYRCVDLFLQYQEVLSDRPIDLFWPVPKIISRSETEKLSTKSTFFLALQLSFPIGYLLLSRLITLSTRRHQRSSFNCLFELSLRAAQLSNFENTFAPLSN